MLISLLQVIIQQIYEWMNRNIVVIIEANRSQYAVVTFNFSAPVLIKQSQPSKLYKIRNFYYKEEQHNNQNLVKLQLFHSELTETWFMSVCQYKYEKYYSLIISTSSDRYFVYLQRCFEGMTQGLLWRHHAPLPVWATYLWSSTLSAWRVSSLLWWCSRSAEWTLTSLLKDKCNSFQLELDSTLSQSWIEFWN